MEEEVMRQLHKVYLVLGIVLIFSVVMLSDNGPGSANISIAFLGYTNTAQTREALLSLKNDSEYAVLRNGSCTIAYLDGTQRSQEFYHITPSVKKIEAGNTEVVKVPIKDTAQIWNVAFSFYFAPDVTEVFLRRFHLRSRSAIAPVFVRLSPNVTNGANLPQ